MGEPHSVKVGPTIFAYSPRVAGVQSVKPAIFIIEIPSSTNNKPPIRQEREAVIKSRLRQVWNFAGDRVARAGGEREQVDVSEDRDVVPATNDHMTFG